MEKETYQQITKRHQKEFNNLPIFFAFNTQQFKEEWKDLD